MTGVYKNGLCKRGSAILLAIAVVLGILLLPGEGGMQTVYAADSTIHSMEYYSANDGPVLTSSGVGEASYGFVMPIFNGGESSWQDVSGDLAVRVKVDGTYTDIDNVSSFVYNQNWGHWNDSGFTGYWFKVSQTTELQLYSKATGVSLDYTLEFTNVEKTTITSMTATQGPELTAGPTGSIGFTYPTFNGDSSVIYDAVAEDLKVYVKTLDSSEWIDIDNNAASGWIYDKNFGQFTDGPGGYWFTLTESINVKLESKTSHVSLIYTLNYEKAARNSNKITAYEETTTYTADANGAIGFALPKIDGNAAYESDLENFVYEVKIDGRWVELSDYGKSTFSYSGNGYNKMSDKNQWGYWVDYIYGLWFQPVQQDYELRIGYPENGEKGGAINDNYVYYTLIGNPSAPRPELPDDNFQVGDPNDAHLDGWELVFNDEFTGDALNTDTWNYVTGYYIDDDPDKWGWGNNELEYYTDSEKNVNVSGGTLNITAYEEPKSFPQDPDRYAQYSSGKITTKDKFSFKYGRIDFRAKLPAGNGLWPALWLLPNDDTYGTWAASGEIDVMEARGRLPGASSGAIHFGGTWPANTYIGGDYAFTDGERIDTDYHLYSLVWEEDMLKWYVDGELFFYATSDQWYTTASSEKGAPFDQEFYIIMNLAVGGWFDGGITPEAGDIPATMQVDYVRVYKAEGDTRAASSGTAAGSNETQLSAKTETVSATQQLSAGTGMESTTVKSVSMQSVANQTGDDSAVTEHGSRGKYNNNTQPETMDSTDKPELRTDIVQKEEQMFFQFNNKTNGAYSDDQIYWCILGFDPKDGKLCYVDKDGTLVPATTELDTISKGDRKCADIYYTLSEKNYVYMPDIVSGRIYVSYGSPVYVTINSDANGNIGFAGPDLNNPTDPNQDVYFEFIEFTITNGEYWGNTTRVDFFSFPVVSRLIGEDGFISTPGDADVYDKTVGDIGTRDEIFAAFEKEVPTEFQTLIQAPYRIMAPCKATFNEGGSYANYFDAYIDRIWEKYRNEDLVFTCQAGTFTGRTSGDSIIFSKDGGESNLVVNRPTTQDVLEGKGTLAAGTDMEKVVEAQLCAAINRGVALTPEKWSDSSAFYQSEPANFYSGFFHDHSVDGLAYGFCYDDVFDYSTLLHYTEPTVLVIDLKW